MGVICIVLSIILAAFLIPTKLSGLYYRLKADKALQEFKIKIFLLEHKGAVAFAMLFLIIIYAFGESTLRKSSEIDDPLNIEAPTIGTTAESTYEFILKDCSWDEAYNDCIAYGGHLLTIESDNEYQRIVRLIKEQGHQKTIFYVGAARAKDGADYYWVNCERYFVGESINHLPYWLDGEPSLTDSISGVTESCVELFYYDADTRWVLNDIPNNILEVAPFYSGRIGYIIEY